MKLNWIALILLLLAGSAFAQENPAPPPAAPAPQAQENPPSIGLAVGEKAPPFSAPDQFGHEQTLDSLKGPKGTVLLFFRSADWCPYCKGQLIQLQSAKAAFDKQGIKLAAISYDSVEILKYFAGRKNIEFEMLSDPESKTIQDYDVLNTEATGFQKGMARPGYFFIDTKGIIREKFFETNIQDRFSGNNVIGKLFPELGAEVTDKVDAPHLHLNLEQSDRSGYPGNIVTLAVEVQLPADVHVYSPGVKGYKPIDLTLDPSPSIHPAPANYPPSKELYLPVIKERVPIFAGTFRISEDVKIDAAQEFISSLGTDGKALTISGKLEYQACDDKICYLAASVPVQWQLQVVPLDRQRAPDDIRHK
jgi:peroxiredoxin